MLKVLVVAVLALVLAGGAWALFLREEDQGHPLLVGALEDLHALCGEGDA